MKNNKKIKAANVSAKKRNKFTEKIATIAITVLAVFACLVFNPSGFDVTEDFIDIPAVAADGEAPAAGDAPAAGGAAGAADGDGSDAWGSLMGTFVKWIQRAGGVVIFVGGIMFAFAIKNNDAEQKQTGLLTMIAGFCVVAVCGISSTFMN